MVDATVASAGPERDTLPKLLMHNARIRPTLPAYREKDYGIWQTWSWREVEAEIFRMAAGLAELGFKRGDRMAIVGDNRPQLYWSMVAAQVLGGVPVPVYQDSVADEMVFVLEHAEVTFAMVEDQEQVDKLLECRTKGARVDHIIYEDPRGLRNYREEGVHALSAVLDSGARRLGREPDFAATEAKQGSGADLALMAYTSGTTGKPKGVMLTFDNLLTVARAAAEMEGLSERDEILAYLPMAWVGDFAFSVAQAYLCGFTVNCPESGETLLIDLREIGPTYLFSPPRIFENLLTTVMIRMEDAGSFKRRLFHYFMDHARTVGVALMDGRPVSLVDRLKYWLGELLVYGPLKNVLGFSRIRLAYTAGEAIGPEIFDFYRSIGINLKQIYGSTEASVFITVQPNGEVKPDTVGRPYPGVEIRIAENGEVMFKSAGVFAAYYKNDEATRETKTDDGWVHTGDAGLLDGDGHLKIIDRAKDVGHLNNGTMFAPKYIENKLKFFPFIKEAVAFGHERDYAAAFINIDLEAVGNWAERINLAYAGYADLASRPEVYAQIKDCVEKVNADLAQDDLLAGGQIRRFLILHKELDADDGELTRTRKVRRKFVAEKYAPQIAALYDEQVSEVYCETEVTQEDGRKYMIKADLRISPAKTFDPVRKAG
ncbi:AMP-binding protein [Roseospirillum parvum]|uniref:Long-chain acyl-CoA synthetase n=1 Tax=Roseospirillum parvum TaxID=83401 RepID=A0A1G8EFP4_9PROT|nr:AMP-binding protein [Roseospirillum parvum]SDH68742.1 long-chain acyl-CoA synthetase [Roseospirillum parvum]